MKVSKRRGLRQDAAEGEVKGICLDGEGQFRLEVGEDGGRGEGLLEVIPLGSAIRLDHSLMGFRCLI